MNSTQSEPQRIPFNLERALAGDPVVRRDGVKVSEVLRFKGGNVLKPVISLSENGESLRHYESGALYPQSAGPRDLFMAPKTKTVWINLYMIHKGIIQTSGNAHSSLSDAEDWNDSKGYLKTISVEVPA